ncbi:MAG: NUMOD4 motif-containing HNH endonuclease [Pantoea sp.]|uniref:NUMOD4 motif-containing HNH endonuclease n=1 Tax=Pantoea sp. TaxID=69393 RepID=UPI0039E453AE
MQEIWKELDFNKRYMISNLGRVKTLDGYDSASRVIKGQQIKPFIVKNTGYLQVKISGKKYSVHRLIALAFCDGYSPELVVNHKNGVRDDNRAENLEWVTHSENLRHAYRELGKRGRCLGKFSSEHHVSRRVISTDLKTGEQRAYLSGMDAVREGFDSSSICRCCYGKYRHHKGKAWRFATDADTAEIKQWIGYSGDKNRSAA